MKSGRCRYTKCSTPGQFPSPCSTDKVLVTISRHAKRVLVISYIPAETSSSGTYYAYILINSKSVSEQKHHEKFVSRILVLHNNLLAHYPYVAQAAIKQCGFEELPHPAHNIGQTSSED